MKKRRPDEVLEEYLNERTIPDDPELASLARVADRLERGLNVEAPEVNRERALFVQGAAARKPGFPWMRLLIPATAISVLVAFVAIGRNARPGDALYGFRQTLDRVGLAEDPARSARTVLDDAEDEVLRAENLLEQDMFGTAFDVALEALALTRAAEELLEDGSGSFLETQSDRLEDLTTRAVEVIEESVEERSERAEEALEERLDQDEDSGPGGDDNRGGDDDNSGKGGGGDSGGDDNSGNGGDDSGGGDGSSGPGSDGDSSGGGDSGGSGSGGDSGGGGGDSSGSGSGG